MVSNPSEQQQDQEYDQNHPDKPHPGMAMAVAVPPEATRKAAQKDDDQDDDEYRPKRHATLPEGRRASPNACAVRSKHIPGRESLEPMRSGMTTTSLFLRLVDRQYLQRRRIGLDAEAVIGDQGDLVQRRLLEIAAGGFAHRILPRRHRAPGDQHLG